MSTAKLPSISDVNKATGANLKTIYKQVFGAVPDSGDSTKWRKDIIDELKKLAKAPSAAPTSEDNAKFTATEKAARDAEKKGEWLTAALAWEAVAKMLGTGKGKDLAIERAAAARVNAKAPADKAPKNKVDAVDSAATKAAVNTVAAI